MLRPLVAGALLACAPFVVVAQQKPADAGGAGQNCRTMLKASATHTQGHGFTTDTTTACTFDTATSKGTCTNTYKDNFGTKTTTVSVTTFKSPADAIDEVTVIPPRRRSLRTVSTTIGPRGKTTSTLVNMYDRQHRLVEEVGMATARQKHTTTYARWDAVGRPTAGRTVNPGGIVSTLAISYNNATRTQTTTSTTAGLRISCDMAFDANGNAVSTTCVGAAASSSKATTRITATERVCR